MSLNVLTTILSILYKEQRNTYCSLFELLWGIDNQDTNFDEYELNKEEYIKIDMSKRKQIESKIKRIEECIKYIKG